MSAPAPSGVPQAPLVRLGLIGGNIAASRSPDLHRLSGEATGLVVSYELLVPAQLGLDFAGVFALCQSRGLRGINVTYPFKETVTSLVRIQDPEVARLGSINTVVFETDGPTGFNTDYTGFMAAYRVAFGEVAPGRVAVVGAGGVGRAIVFALARLGANQLRLFDAASGRAQDLARAVRGLGSEAPDIFGVSDIADALDGVEGIVNCTPLGMNGHPGTAVPAALIGAQRWAFDAVYTPIDTEFLIAARRAGLATISGYELFFHQGIQAFKLFTGRVPQDLDALYRRLQANPV